MLSPETALAALADGRHYSHPAAKPEKLKTDSGVSLEVPGPRTLADSYALPLFSLSADLYRDGRALVTRPKGSDDEPTPLNQLDLARDLLEALQALPDLPRAEAGRPYRDLRLFLDEVTPARRAKYLSDAVNQVRLLAPVWKRPTPATTRAPAKSNAERAADFRARSRTAQEASAREWLASYLDEDNEDRPVPGSRVVALDLYKEAAAIIEEYADGLEELEDGTPYRVPGKTVFYAVADELLGPRKRGAHGSAHVYTIP